MEPAERFYKLFLGYEHARGEYTIVGTNARGKVQGNASTVAGGPTIEHWKQHIAGTHNLGVVPLRADDSVHWGCIDIDKIGIDHTELEKLCEPLPVVVARSKSGGAHVYLFLAQPLPARIVRARLTHWAAFLGHPGVEIFPKQIERVDATDIGNWLNMPYQASDMTLRYAFKAGQRLTMLEFLDYAESRRVTLEQLDEIKVEAPKRGPKLATSSGKRAPPPLKGTLFLDGPPCLQVLTADPLQEGTRNSILFNIAVYLRKRHPESWQEKLSYANKQLLDPPLGEREIQTIVKSVSRKTYTFTCKQAPLEGVCNRPVCVAREFGVGTTTAEQTGGLDVTHVKKIQAGDEVYWEITISDHVVRLRTKELMSQDKFCEVCMERANFVWQKMPAPRWAFLLQRWLDMADTEIAPLEASRIGQFGTIIHQFCNGNVQAHAENEIVLGKPYRDAGSNRTLFTPMALLNYLNHQRFQFTDVKEVWAMLKQVGGTDTEITVVGRKIAAWSVPTTAAPEYTEKLGKPDYGGENF